MKNRCHLLFLPLGLFFLLLSGCNKNSDSAAPGTNGTGGSMARFAITGNVLYTLDNRSLHVFDISQAENPLAKSTISVGTDIETIFPYQDKLFIGSRMGMFIYDNQNPFQPTLISEYSHVQSCDPVVVQGNYAYVTLRNGTNCRNGINTLDVVDISNLKNPTLVRSIPMQNPHGLGVDGQNLFVCEGDYGLKVFNIQQPDNPVQSLWVEGIKTYDVIPLHNILLVTGKDGLYQYDYSDHTRLRELSKINLVNN